MGLVKLVICIAPGSGGFFISLNIHFVKTHTPQALQLRLSMNWDSSVFDAQTIKSTNDLHP